MGLHAFLSLCSQQGPAIQMRRVLPHNVEVYCSTSYGLAVPGVVPGQFPGRCGRMREKCQTVSPLRLCGSSLVLISRHCVIASHAEMQRQLKSLKSRSEYGSGQFHFLVMVISHCDKRLVQ